MRGTTRLAWLSLLLVGCGGESSPIGPSPTPVSPATFSGSVTETLTGAPVSGFTATVAGSRLTVSAPGYVTRETRASAQAVDLIREAAPFDLGFYRQFIRNAHEGGLEPLRRHSVAPRIYVRTVDEAGGPIDAQTLRVVTGALQSGIVETWSGGAFGLAGLEQGTETRSGMPGWITVRWPTDIAAPSCGRATVGGDYIELRNASTCGCTGAGTYARLVKHELGHVLGYWHTDSPGDVMYRDSTQGCDSTPSAREQYHARIAYSRPVGSRDVDVDPTGTQMSRSHPVVVD